MKQYRHTRRTMSTANRERALRKLERVAVEIAQGSPKYHPSRETAPLDRLGRLDGAPELEALKEAIRHLWTFRHPQVKIRRTSGA